MGIKKVAPVVNDVTRLNPVAVQAHVAPQSIAELQELVREHSGPISIGGGRYSMGGQTATDGALFIDMTKLNRIVDYQPSKRKITVQTGATWQQIVGYIDPEDMSISVMQSFANFTVGGALGVNCHGRYKGAGPLISSVSSIKLVMADGTLVAASPSENAALFHGAIGGYGGLGVIVEASLNLAHNANMARQVAQMPLANYGSYFERDILKNEGVIFHNGDLYPPFYDNVTATSYVQTDRPVTVSERLRPKKSHYLTEKLAIFAATQIPGTKRLRATIDQHFRLRSDEVLRRNYEACHYVEELEPFTRAMTTYVLQEYFVPVGQLNVFAPQMIEILQRHKVNALNISIRHATQDPSSLLAWAPKSDVFAFVLYYKQWNHLAARERVGIWTRELIDAALASGGTYYLPYQLHASQAQFKAAYPRADEFFALKRQVDPDNKFRNKLWDKYGDAAQGTNTAPSEPVSPSLPRHRFAKPEQG